MNDVQTHYNRLLAEHYSWMFGDYTKLVEENIYFFKRHQIIPRTNSMAIDLGCGSGFQSVALADLGFCVFSVDLCLALLRELENHRGNRVINIKQADLIDFNQYYGSEAPEVIICMGDTLTHLDSLPTVVTLFEKIRDCLQPGGRFILTYRDMTQELEGLDRFIPVRSDDNKIMTTFLEYMPGYVVVHDLIYTKFTDEWVLSKSSYKKIRINSSWLKESLLRLGMSIEYEGIDKGFDIIIAVKQ